MEYIALIICIGQTNCGEGRRCPDKSHWRDEWKWSKSRLCKLNKTFYLISYSMFEILFCVLRLGNSCARTAWQPLTSATRMLWPFVRGSWSSSYMTREPKKIGTRRKSTIRDLEIVFNHNRNFFLTLYLELSLYLLYTAKTAGKELKPPAPYTCAIW